MGTTPDAPTPPEGGTDSEPGQRLGTDEIDLDELRARIRRGECTAQEIEALDAAGLLPHDDPPAELPELPELSFGDRRTRSFVSVMPAAWKALVERHQLNCWHRYLLREAIDLVGYLTAEVKDESTSSLSEYLGLPRKRVRRTLDELAKRGLTWDNFTHGHVGTLRVLCYPDVVYQRPKERQAVLAHLAPFAPYRPNEQGKHPLTPSEQGLVATDQTIGLHGPNERAVATKRAGIPLLSSEESEKASPRARWGVGGGRRVALRRWRRGRSQLGCRAARRVRRLRGTGGILADRPILAVRRDPGGPDMTGCRDGLCGPPRKRYPTLRELDDFDAAEVDRLTLIRGRDARRLRSLAGGGQAPAQPPLPPSLELVDGEALTASVGPRRRSRRRGGAA